MIAGMKKYGFLVHRYEYGHFLHQLQALGIIHIAEKAALLSESTLNAERDLKKVKEIIQKLESENQYEDDGSEKAAFSDSMEILRIADNLYATIAEKQINLQNLENEINYATPWGEFDPDTLLNLKNEGIHIQFYRCAEKQFDIEWKEKYRLEIINQTGPDIFFTIIHHHEDRPIIEADELQWPQKSYTTLQSEKATLTTEIEAIQNKLRELTAFMPDLRSLEQDLFHTLQFSTAYDHSAEVVDNKVYLLEGFVPVDTEAKLQQLCEEEQVIYVAERIKPSDNPPVLLRNNRFTALYESIAGLYSLPAYGEIDLTPFFAPFFMLFFGFCLGDAGYGVVLLIASFTFKKKVKPALQPALRLAQWLGLATIIFGIITGTFFGINLVENTPSWARPLSGIMITSNQAFNLALGLGFVQIIFGLILQMANKKIQFGWLYALTPLAWIILLTSILDLAVLKKSGGTALYAVYAAIGMILLFNDPEAGIWTRIGKGLWQLYGITGFVGDLLSYIRLFALGISSAILGLVINDIALRMLHGVPVLGWLLFIVFLVVGHSANLLIASLGAFVHPLRLTFVEFYKNAGFTGGGRKYQPFGGKVSGEGG